MQSWNRTVNKKIQPVVYRRRRRYVRSIHMKSETLPRPPELMGNSNTILAVRPGSVPDALRASNISSGSRKFAHSF